jgi:hypothetical protein
MDTHWKKGPLPPNTWDWGGLVDKDFAKGSGFYFADFRGDHATVYKGEFPAKVRIEAADILWYNNSIKLPPSSMPPEPTPQP